MTLDLRALFSGKEKELPFGFLIDLSEISVGAQTPFATPVRVEGKVESIADTLCLSAEAFVKYFAECDRCGEPCEKEYSVKVGYVLVTELAGEEQDHILVVEDMTIDLDELLREEIILSIPSKHLCSENCKGLCVTCGKNLNEGECSCNKKQIDSRLEILKNLLD